MKLLSHTHVNGNGPDNVEGYALQVAKKAQDLGYSHYVIGCHNDWPASCSLLGKLRRRFTPVPVRFMELSITAPFSTKGIHIGLLNVPCSRVAGYKDSCCGIEDILGYVRQCGCRVVLHHPDTLDHVRQLAPHLDGWEVCNGVHTSRPYGVEDVVQFPTLIPFFGADWHVWENHGNPELYTELPDDWFGAIYD